MRAADFREHKSGRLVQTPRDSLAFAPAPLEPPLALGIDLVQALSSADRALAELAGVARNLPNPYLLIGPFVRQEAVLSSRIEGTQASLSDLLFFEAANIGEANTPDVREVANYVSALEYGLDRLQEFPLSLRLIREMHERLLEGVRGRNLTPGEFRRSQNWIGPPGCTLMNATYVPPPVEEMKQALSDLEHYLHAQPSYPPLIRLALVHYQFEAIHPFLDGNGRIGRLLTTLLLCADGLLPHPLLYLSAYFERHRDDYYRLLLQVSQTGSWTEWITFFLRAVETQSKDAIARSDQLLQLWRDYRAKLQEARASALLLRLVDDLFAHPVVTSARASNRLGITPRSAQLNIDKLVAAGILRETTGQKRNRVYVASGIVEIVELAKEE